MSKNIENFERLFEHEFHPLGFEFDPQEELRKDYERLCQEVDEGYLTPLEANDMYDLMRQHYGLDS